MLFDVHVVSPLEFPDWVKKTASSGRVLNADSYKKLARQSIETGKPTYRLENPLLFDEIVTRKIPPSPGPHITSDAAQSYLGAPDAR